MKKYFIGLVILSASAMFPPLKAEVIKGTVINASHDSTAVANTPVHLLSFTQGASEPMEISETKSSSRGQFQFNVTLPDSLANYFAAVDNDGVRYYSQGAHLHTSIEAQLQQVVVYDTTNSMAQAQTLMRHIFIEDLGNGLLFRETHIVNNPTPYAMTNALDAGHVGRATLHMKLPQNAVNFQQNANLSFQPLIQHGADIYDQSVIPPGNHQVTYTYEIPWRGNIATVDLGVGLPTRTFDIFVNNPDFTITSMQLQDLGPFTIRNEPYRRFGAKDLAPGATIQFSISRTAGSREPSVPTLLFTVLILSAGVAFAFIFKPAAATTLSAQDKERLQKRRSDLVREIARLDIGHESQPEPEYATTRQRLFAELEHVDARLRKSGKSQAKSKKR